MEDVSPIVQGGTRFAPCPDGVGLGSVVVAGVGDCVTLPPGNTPLTRPEGPTEGFGDVPVCGPNVAPFAFRPTLIPLMVAWANMSGNRPPNGSGV